jgi:cell division control protein 45
MILELEHWYLGYSQILVDCRANDDGTPGSALILCNADVDAMSAARILSYMLRSDGISYQLLPCMAFSHMQKILARGKAQDVRAVILLNMGASRNLTRLFDREPFLDPSLKLYVMDSRRPVHLANVHAGDNVVVFWDQTQTEELPSDGDNLSGNESSSDSEDDDEEDDDSSMEGENEFDDNENADEGEQEFGADDDDTNTNTNEIAPPFVDGNNGDEGGDEADYDGEDERDGADEQATKSKRRKIKEGDDKSNQASTDQELGSDDEQDTSQAKRPVAASTDDEPNMLPAMTPKELHLGRRNRLRMYYTGGTFYGSPAAYVAYRVSTQLRFGEVGDLLWLACVGVTDAYLHSRLDVSGYTALAMDIRGYTNRLFPNDMFHRAGNAVYAEHLTGGSGRPDSQQLTKIGFSENGRILSETDFRFFLLRHTTLFDALVYSDYISTKFQLSTSRGMHKLQEMLAKMGYPLDECHQPFAFMKPSLRRVLQKQFREHAEEYGLENFEFTSFFRVTGYQSLLSASDTSYAVTALLECDTPARTASTSSNPEEQEEEELMQSFNIAYDALNSNATPTASLNGLTGEGSNLVSLVNGGNLSGNNGIGAGIRLAMSLQKSIMATAASLIDRSAITRLSHFCYAYVTCTSQGGEHQGPGEDVVKTGQKSSSAEEKHHVFAKPLALSRLAHYLMDLHRENGKWNGAKARPLILMAEKPRTKTYVVVGYEYPERAGHFVKNRFGKNFELATQSMKGTFRFDSFDSNVVEVNGGDVQRFIEQLHYLMDSM